MEHPTKRGIGTVIVLVCVALAVIATMAYAQSLLSNQVISMVHRSSLGITAQYLAESACQEAAGLVECAVNDPGRAPELFARFRAQGAESPAAFTVPGMSLDDLTKTAELLETVGKGRCFRLDEFSTEVVLQKRVGPMVADTFGTLRFHTRVAARMERGVARTVDEYRDFRVGLVSTPQPFGAATMFLGSARNVLPEDANLYIARCYEDSAELGRATDWLVKVIGSAQDGNLKKSFMAVAEACKQQLAELGPLLSGKPTPQLHLFGDPLCEGKPPITSMDDLALAVSYTKMQVLPLVIFDQRQRIQAMQTAFDAAATKARQAFSDVQQSATSSQGLTGKSVIAFRQACAEYVAAVKRLAPVYYAVQDLCIELTGESLASFRTKYVERLRPEEWPQRAFFKVRSMPELAALLQATRPISGILVSESNDPLVWSAVCNAPFQGKLVVVHRGPVVLDGTAVAQPSLDNLTFVCAGASVTLSGTVQASVVLADVTTPPRLDTTGLQNLLGSLVSARQLEFTAGQLAGTVTHDPTQLSLDDQGATKLNHVFVAVAPPLRAKEVKRT